MDTNAVEYFPALKQLFVLGVVGSFVGVGSLLASQEKYTWRMAAGRLVTSASLGATAAGVLAWIPSLPLVAQCGIAAALASLGTSGLTMLFQRFLQK